MGADVIYTIGHSTHAADVFLELLTQNGIAQLADVRAVPASRRHPHFGRDRLKALLDPRGIDYRHFPALGGLRRPRPDSINTSWRNDAFRGYADYMQTDAFAHAVDELVDYAAAGATAIMCAEADRRHCHRQLLSDALLVRGVPVRHIRQGMDQEPHQLTDFARQNAGKVSYPGLL
jgi:uncharacterized protein (DUF488 family)